MVRIAMGNRAGVKLWEMDYRSHKGYQQQVTVEQTRDGEIQAVSHAARITGNSTNDSTVEHITRFATCSGERLARTAIR